MEFKKPLMDDDVRMLSALTTTSPPLSLILCFGTVLLLCYWTCPADFGKVQGIYTPSWWNRNWNQHGQFKLLTVNDGGSYIDGIKRSDVALNQLGINDQSQIQLRIAAPKGAKNAGGLTVYGHSFGNYDQDIRVRFHYREAAGNA